MQGGAAILREWKVKLKGICTDVALRAFLVYFALYASPECETSCHAMQSNSSIHCKTFLIHFT